MVRFQVVSSILLFSVLSALPSYGYNTENSDESGIRENGTEAGLQSASEASVSNGNEADTHQQSMASFEANSENGAVFLDVSIPKYIPALPSGLPPDSSISRTPPSNYVKSPTMPSNYVVSRNSSSSASQNTVQSASAPEMKVWTTGKYKTRRHTTEMLASKPTPNEIKHQPVQQMVAPVQQYYQMSSSDDSPLPVSAGFGGWPNADAFNHQ